MNVYFLPLTVFHSSTHLIVIFMKKLTLLLLSLWAVLFVAQPVYAGFSTQPAPQMTEAAAPKAPKGKLAEKATKLVQKIAAKPGIINKIKNVQGDIKNKWLILMIICLIGAIVFYIIPGFYWLGYLLSAATSVFFILWLLTYLDII